MKNQPTPLLAPFVEVPFPLGRRRETVEPFARLVRTAPQPTFTVEILAARAELARAYHDRGSR